jgi:peptidoglycan/LPS O-acetylase OafA/YrhL
MRLNGIMALQGSQHGSEGRFYHPELDALRFFAFLVVFFHHALPADASLYTAAGFPAELARWLLLGKHAGAYGVDLFFALSAYLITELLIREYHRRGSIDIWAFYVRRALRIWPLYFAFLAITILIVPFLFPADDFNWKYALMFTLFVGNWACVWWGVPFSVASPLWSVSIEEQFYLAWPILIFFFGIKRLPQIAVVMLVIAFAMRIVLATARVGDPAVWCNTFARLDPIALGALLAYGLGGRAPNLNTASRIALGAGGLLLWLVTSRYFSLYGFSSLITYPAIGLGSVMLLIAALRPEANSFLRSPLSLLVYLGRISYGLYVFHLLALAIMSQQLFVPVIGLQLGFASRLIIAFFLTVVLAAISYRWLERPFLRLKPRFTHVASTRAPS